MGFIICHEDFIIELETHSELRTEEREIQSFIYIIIIVSIYVRVLVRNYVEYYVCIYVSIRVYNHVYYLVCNHVRVLVHDHVRTTDLHANYRSNLILI